MIKGAERFFKVYANLPIEERKLTVVVIEKEPISWDLAHEEIKNNTKRGEKILKTLTGLDLI